MGQLIDTSVFVALERRALPLDRLAAVVPDAPMAMAAITASELLVGVHRADSVQRRQRRAAVVEAILAQIAVIPFDLRVARAHAHLVAELGARGQLFGAHDMQIVATALAVGCAVTTDSLRDFARVAALEVWTPVWEDLR